MLTFHGKSIYNGIAIGKLKTWKKDAVKTEYYQITDVEKELNRLKNAIESSKNQLEKLKNKAAEEIGVENSAIFEIHILMLEDSDYINLIESQIKSNKANAEYAVSFAAETFSEIFSAMDDTYMQARASDVKDISLRIINNLTDFNPSIIFEEPVILVAEDFTPSETLQFDKSKILAFVTEKGSVNSHTAILARSMNIPAIIGIDLSSLPHTDNKLAIVDGFSGNLYIDPDDTFLQENYKKADLEKEKRKSLENLKGKETITIDGKKINLFANIGNIKDISQVIDNDAEGIGLFRSEFIFLEKNTFPSEEEQFAIYKNAVETMNGKKVIIRTLDIGADKKIDYFKLKDEENPALGLRAIRLCIKRPDIFMTQLRALLRASIYGNLSIMYPMITSIEELTAIKNILSQTAADLESLNIPFSIPEQGIMIETPASVMISDKLAKEVSFFSIGTNDLSQYTMAIDRQNEQLDDFFNPYHDAILKMIKTTVDNAHKAGIWVGICGELAADLNMTEKFLEMGVDELSVSPGRILSLRKKIRETNSNKK